MKLLEKYTFGMGDRFAHQGEAQLRAIALAQERGLEVTPVWNKSNREHTIIGSHPDDLRMEADAAVAALGWRGTHHVDADHIGLKTVDRFLAASDFFTLDVADFVGAEASSEDVEQFVAATSKYLGRLEIPGMDRKFEIDTTAARAVAEKFLRAVQEAGRIYRHIESHKGASFITEISVDETDQPQSPAELFLILAMIAREGIPAQTIAPKFTGRFNKGVDYVGDAARFEQEFDENLSVLAFAIQEFGFPPTLKLSVHSGSDKFALYPIINRLLKKHDAGVHVKTAGTTWLEELIGLAESDGEGLQVAREIYAGAHARFAELAAPYATVVDIDPTRLPSPELVADWSTDEFAAALRHDQACAAFNPHLRQLLHVGFKVAAEMKPRYEAALDACAPAIARNVTSNLFDRHIVPIFG